MMKIEKENLIEIGKVNNGYIIKTYIWETTNEQGIKEYSEQTEVIEEEDSNEAIKRLLYLIAEKCGNYYDKYGTKNLNISFDKKGAKA
ncbi:MAG: hypothetical protein ACTSXD_11620 [Candidatus Heimdallarchaeaceae archaeon]